MYGQPLVHLISVSGHFIHFIFKICQTAADISMIKQFHEFFSLIFGGILQLGPNVLWCASEVRNELEAVNNEASTCHGARDWRQQPYVSALQE